MNRNQFVLPCYWIFHSRSQDDVLIETAAKDFQTCQNLAMELFPKEFEEWVEEGNNWEFSIFQIGSA